MSTLRTLASYMGDCISELLCVLAEGQRRSMQLSFKEEVERTTWDYTPRERRGLPLREMDRSQQQSVSKLLHLALSHRGLNTVSVIMALETILDVREGFSRPLPGRDSSNYCLTVFGLPDDQLPWGWRFEGHHVSLHFTISQGMIVSPFPLFLGSNPRECELAGGILLRPLMEFEDSARELLHMLDEGQQSLALLSPYAPRDIMLGNRSEVEYGKGPMFDVIPWQQETGATVQDLNALCVYEKAKGIEAANLSASQGAQLSGLISKYLECFPDQLAEAVSQTIGNPMDGTVCFAWAGGRSLGDACYYRIQAPDFLIEFDNYQDEANHVHSVWRDPANDFGRTALASHYAASH